MNNCKYLLRYLNRDVITIIKKYVLYSHRRITLLNYPNSSSEESSSVVYLPGDCLLTKNTKYSGQTDIAVVSIKNNNCELLKNVNILYLNKTLTKISKMCVVTIKTIPKIICCNDSKDYFIINSLTFQIEHIFHIKKYMNPTCLTSFFQNNTTYLVIGMYRGKIIVYNLSTFKIVKIFNSKPNNTQWHLNYIMQLNILEKNNNQIIIISGNWAGNIILHEFNINFTFKNMFKKNITLNGHIGIITSILVVNDKIISSSLNKLFPTKKSSTLKIHDFNGNELESFEKFKDLKEVYSMCIIDDNLVVACHKALRFYDLDNFKLTKIIDTQQTYTELKVINGNRLIVLERNSTNISLYI
jgi:hypothetical protein